MIDAHDAIELARVASADAEAAAYRNILWALHSLDTRNPGSTFTVAQIIAIVKAQQKHSATESESRQKAMGA